MLFWLGCFGSGCFYVRDYKKCLWEKGLELTLLFITLEFLKGYLIINIGRSFFDVEYVAYLGVIFALLVTRMTKENEQSAPGVLCLLGALSGLYLEALKLTLACWLSFVLINGSFKDSKYFVVIILPFCLWITKAPLAIIGFSLLGIVIMTFPYKPLDLKNLFKTPEDFSTFFLHEK